MQREAVTKGPRARGPRLPTAHPGSGWTILEETGPGRSRRSPFHPALEWSCRLCFHASKDGALTASCNGLWPSPTVRKGRLLPKCATLPWSLCASLWPGRSSKAYPQRSTHQEPSSQPNLISLLHVAQPWFTAHTTVGLC